jgi:hypothetical protein
MKRPLARFIVPFAWHLTSGIGLVVAAILLAWAWAPDQARTVGLIAAGIVFTAAGVIDAIGSRGKHIGWAPLTLIGLGSLIAAASAQAKPTNDFARYPATIFKGPLAVPKGEWPNKQRDLAHGINFGGHFTLVGIPCGTACGAFWLVDRRTGRMVRAPESAPGLDYVSINNRANSNLLKILWVSAKFDGSGETFPPCFRQSFVWTGAKFRSLSKPIETRCPPDAA